MGKVNPLEMAETVMGVADVAWKAMEFREHYQHHQHQQQQQHKHNDEEEEEEGGGGEEDIESLRAENLRLRSVLEENLKLLQRLSQCPCISDDCPDDLYKQLEAAVSSADFLTRLESLHQASVNAPHIQFPFNKATGADLEFAETIVDVGLKEPSLWVWVNQPSGEELSGIDSDAYVIVNEELVVEGVANFIARCILSNPKAKVLTPVQLQKTITKALGGMNKLEFMVNIWEAGKIFLALSTWGFTLAGIYRHRAVVKVAAKGVATTGRFVLKAL